MRCWIFAIPFYCALAVLLVGCALATPTAPIRPLALNSVTPAPQPQVSVASTSAPPTPRQMPTPTMIALPTPQVFRSAWKMQVYYGLAFSLEQIRAAAGAAASPDVRYVVVTVSLQNVWTAAKDLIGLPMAVSLRDPAAGTVYLSQPFAPLAHPGDNLYEKVDQLSTASAKLLAPRQTVAGDLYFQVPRQVRMVEVIWKPAAQAQWVWGPLEIKENFP